ncbi:DMT family transporter [Cochlodiniinecator piscidefendens]|uniref:DMT family transporter n=1 Tax=Cochlodiniinecator piscidefendens TaxID=2715756 RepID=UPI00140BFFA0|nr:DMT family transporter [Cochlodiniinecator piscidefendens]
MRIVHEQERPNNVALGVALIVGALFITSVQDVIFKFFSSALPLGQIFALRALLALPLLYAVSVLQKTDKGLLNDAFRPWVLLRSLCMTLMFLLFYGAIPFVSLSVLGAGTYTAPIFVTVLSAYAIGESVDRRGWCAVVLGFVGVLVLLRPGTDVFSFWALAPVVGAVFYAIGHILTRTKCQTVPIAALAVSLTITMLVAGLSVSAALLLWPPDEATAHAYPNLLGNWVPVGQNEWVVLGVLAVLTVLIGLGIAGAYKIAIPSTVATFEYSYLVFVVVWDSLFFDSVPTMVTLMGMLMIIGSGYMILKRE